MARFNQAQFDQSRLADGNHEGGEAYRLGSEMELYTAVCTASLQNKFYETKNDTIERIRTLVAQCDHEFTARLAVYAREVLNLRSIPVVLTVELAKVHNGDDLVARLAERVIQRVDEITEMLAYYQIVNDRNGSKKLGKLSNQLRKGIGASFKKFDEYQFSKYDRPTEVKLRDALFLTHPKPDTEEQRVVLQKIVEGNLESPYTWETRLSEAGQNGETKKGVWEELIESRKVGYMAILRNLRNIIEAGVSDDHVQMVCDYLSNETAVLNSRQLPFRFVSAYRMLTTGEAPSIYSARRWSTEKVHNNVVVNDPRLGQILGALEKAVNISIRNIPLFNERDNVLIATDVSGSMCKPVSDRSVLNQYDIGAVLAMMMHRKVAKSVTGLFGNCFEAFPFPKNNILQNAQKVYELEGRVGYSTNGHEVIRHANDGNVDFDKIVIFTDCQMYGGSITQQWRTYKANHPFAKLYMFDLNGYGQSPISQREDDVYLIAGWNEAVFKVLETLDAGNTVIDEINSIEL